jgi:hypothetical protein
MCFCLNVLWWSLSLRRLLHPSVMRGRVIIARRLVRSTAVVRGTALRIGEHAHPMCCLNLVRGLNCVGLGLLSPLLRMVRRREEGRRTGIPLTSRVKLLTGCDLIGPKRRRARMAGSRSSLDGGAGVKARGISRSGRQGLDSG